NPTAEDDFAKQPGDKGGPAAEQAAPVNQANKRHGNPLAIEPLFCEARFPACPSCRARWKACPTPQITNGAGKRHRSHRALAYPWRKPLATIFCPPMEKRLHRASLRCKTGSFR